MARWECENNRGMHDRWSLGTCAKEVKCGVAEYVRWNTLKWFCHIEGMKSEAFVKKMYVSEIKGTSRRGRPLLKWKY